MSWKITEMGLCKGMIMNILSLHLVYFVKNLYNMKNMIIRSDVFNQCNVRSQWEVPHRSTSKVLLRRIRLRLRQPLIWPWVCGHYNKQSIILASSFMFYHHLPSSKSEHTKELAGVTESSLRSTLGSLATRTQQRFGLGFSGKGRPTVACCPFSFSRLTRHLRTWSCSW